MSPFIRLSAEFLDLWRIVIEPSIPFRVGLFGQIYIPNEQSRHDYILFISSRGRHLALKNEGLEVNSSTPKHAEWFSVEMLYLFWSECNSQHRARGSDEREVYAKFQSRKGKFINCDLKSDEFPSAYCFIHKTHIELIINFILRCSTIKYHTWTYRQIYVKHRNAILLCIVIRNLHSVIACH